MRRLGEPSQERRNHFKIPEQLATDSKGTGAGEILPLNSSTNIKEDDVAKMTRAQLNKISLRVAECQELVEYMNGRHSTQQVKPAPDRRWVGQAFIALIMWGALIGTGVALAALN